MVYTSNIYLKTAIYIIGYYIHSSHTRARTWTVIKQLAMRTRNLSLISSEILPFFFWCKESFQLCEAMKEAGIAIQFLPSESIDRVVEVFCLWKLLCTNTIQCNSSAHSFFVKCPFPSFSNPCEVQLFLHSPLEWLDQWDMLTWREELLYSLVKDQECAMNRERVPWIPVISLTLAFILNEPSC